MDTKQKQGAWGRLFFQMLLHPIFLVIYGLAWFYLARLARDGQWEKDLPLLLLCGLFFALYSALFLLRGLTGFAPGGLFARSFSRPYRVLAGLVLGGLTLFFGWQTALGCQSGALARKLRDWENQRTLTPTHTNLFEFGLRGLLEDIAQEVELPGELYLGDGLDLLFDQDGSLCSLYGQGADGQLQSFQLAYDRDISGQLTIYLLGVTDAPYAGSRRLGPLLDTLDHLSLPDALADWTALGYDTFGLLYSGLRNWGEAPENLFYLDADGQAQSHGPDHAAPVINYSVSLYLPALAEGDPLTADSSAAYRPRRYVYVENLADIGDSNAAGRALLQQELALGQTTDEDALPTGRE